MSDTMIEGADRAENADSADPPPVLFLHGIDRHYRQGDVTLDILKNAELAVWPGQSIARAQPRAPARRPRRQVPARPGQAEPARALVAQAPPARPPKPRGTRTPAPGTAS